MRTLQEIADEKSRKYKKAVDAETDYLKKKFPHFSKAECKFIAERYLAHMYGAVIDHDYFRS